MSGVRSLMLASILWLTVRCDAFRQLSLMNSKRGLQSGGARNAQMKVPHNRSFANIKIINEIFDILLATDSDLSLEVR